MRMKTKRCPIAAWLLPVAVVWVLFNVTPRALLANDPAKTQSAADESATDEDDEYELQKMFVDTLEHIEQNYVKKVTRRQLIEAAIRGMLNELDPYSSYIDPEHLEQFRSSMEAQFGGIGVQIGVEGRRLRVISPLFDTPAYHAGLMAGDVIVEIDGQSTKGISLEEASHLLRGKPGTTVRLKVLHQHTAEPEEVEITRAVIHVPTVVGFRRKSDGHWDYFFDRQEGIGYIRITAFSRNTADELHRVLEQLHNEGLSALILDLRFNPGGLLRSAIQVSDLFLDHGVIVSTKGRNVPESTWKAHKEGTYTGFPMVVLVNRYSASASEIVAACLQDHKRALVVGERTWGKGSVQNLIPLENNHSALKLTTSSYYRPSGKNIHRFPNAKEEDEWGVHPDDGYEVKMSSRELVALLEDRRRRDRIAPKETATTQREETATAAPATPENAPASEASKSEDGEKEATDAATAEQTTEKESKPSPPFEDRHLVLAVEYLSSQLAKAEQAEAESRAEQQQEKPESATSESAAKQPAEKAKQP